MLHTSFGFFSGLVAAAIVFGFMPLQEARAPATPGASSLTTGGATIERLIVSSDSNPADKLPITGQYKT